MRTENCTLLGYYAANRSTFYRRFGTSYWSYIQGSRIQAEKKILDTWRRDRWVVPKRREEISTTNIIAPKSAVLKVRTDLFFEYIVAAPIFLLKYLLNEHM
jgi:hypothetical protein